LKGAFSGFDAFCFFAILLAKLWAMVFASAFS
jgi:hypothetical protein